MTDWMQWESLRKFGNSRLVQATAIIPVLGYVILFNAELSDYLRIFDEVDAPSRLYFLYFGFCFLTIGSVLFSVRCPAEVKEHGSAYDFVTKQALIMHDRRLDAMHLELVRAEFARLYVGTDYDFEIAYLSPGPAVDETPDDLYSIRLKLKEYSMAISDWDRDSVMREYFEMLEESRPKSRLATFSMYAIGFVLVSVPTAQVFFLVATDLITNISGS